MPDLSNTERNVLEFALDSLADMAHDRAEGPGDVAMLRTIVSIAAKHRLDFLAEHWSTMADALDAEFAPRGWDAVPDTRDVRPER